MAISWFWFLGAAYLTQFPNFTKIHLMGNEAAVSFLLALFSVGIALGSMLCDKMSKNRIDVGIVPIGSIGITIFGALMAFAVPSELPQFTSFSEFISHSSLWPVFGYLLLLGMSGGLFIVPLYALMQQQAKETERARVIAALNIYNSLFMVGSAVLGIVGLSVLELTIVELFLVLALMNFMMATYLFLQAPIFVVRFLIWVLTTIMYRITHKNLHHLPEKRWRLDCLQSCELYGCVGDECGKPKTHTFCHGRRLRELQTRSSLFTTCWSHTYLLLSQRFHSKSV